MAMLWSKEFLTDFFSPGCSFADLFPRSLRRERRKGPVHPSWLYHSWATLGKPLALSGSASLQEPETLTCVFSMQLTPTSGE